MLIDCPRDIPARDAGARVPPTDAGLTVTVVEAEGIAEQFPLCTTALNCVVWVKAVDVYVVEVFPIAVHVLNGETELSHLTTLPV